MKAKQRYHVEAHVGKKFSTSSLPISTRGPHKDVTTGKTTGRNFVSGVGGVRRVCRRGTSSVVVAIIDVLGFGDIH